MTTIGTALYESLVFLEYFTFDLRRASHPASGETSEEASEETPAAGVKP